MVSNTSGTKLVKASQKELSASSSLGNPIKVEHYRSILLGMNGTLHTIDVMDHVNTVVNIFAKKMENILQLKSKILDLPMEIKWLLPFSHSYR